MENDGLKEKNEIPAVVGKKTEEKNPTTSSLSRCPFACGVAALLMSRCRAIVCSQCEQACEQAPACSIAPSGTACRNAQLQVYRGVHSHSASLHAHVALMGILRGGLGNNGPARIIVELGR